MDLGLIQINMLRYVINIQCILKIINRDATFVSTAIQWLWETAYGHNRRSYAKRQKYCHSLMQRRLRSGIHEYVISGVAGVIVKVMSVVHDQTARDREIIGLLRPDPTRRRAATGRSGRVGSFSQTAACHHLNWPITRLLTKLRRGRCMRCLFARKTWLAASRRCCSNAFDNEKSFICQARDGQRITFMYSHVSSLYLSLYWVISETLHCGNLTLWLLCMHKRHS